ncbi:DUF1281 domain-containing protein, partial [Escherichia coli]
MYFSGEPAQIAEIKRLASGAVTPLYRRATNEGIQLFLAGSAGLLQITENIRSEQCPGVTAAGRGAVSLENIAFTRWLTHLQNGVLLDEQNGTVAKLAMRQPFVLFKGLTFQKLCLPGAFRPGDHHNKMLRPG